MSTYKKRNPRKFEADIRGLRSSWAQIGRLYDGNGTLPNDSETFGRQVFDYVAALVNDVSNASPAALRNFDSDAIRTGDGYGNKDWKLDDDYDTIGPALVSAYGPLVRYLTGENDDGFFDTNGGLRPGRFKNEYNIVVTDSDGVMSTRNIYTLLKLNMDDWLGLDYFARKGIASRVLEAVGEDSDLESTLVTNVQKAYANATDAFQIPVGDDAERPANASTGMIRYNENIGELEVWDSDGWDIVGGWTDNDRDTYVQFESNPGSNDDQIVFYVQGSPVATFDSEGLIVSTTGSLTVPVGTTAERPDPSAAGMVRYNTDQTSFEGYNGAAWASLGGVKDVDQDTYIDAESAPTADEDRLSFVTVGIERMRIDSSGRLGINTTTPTCFFDVSTTDAIKVPVGTTAQRPTAATGMIRFNSSQSTFEGYNGAAWSSLGGVTDVDQDTYIKAEDSAGTDNDELDFFTAGTNRLTLSATGSAFTGNMNVTGTITATGDITAFSDERLKTDIQPLDGKKVLEMNGVSFIKDGDRSSGVIAQQLEEVAPELVHTGEDGMKSVAYGNIVGYLIEAIKDQQKQIDELKSQLNKV